MKKKQNLSKNSRNKVLKLLGCFTVVDFFLTFSGSTGIVSQIIINANDGTKGVAVFSPDSAR